jgi:mono/diheme cytochrome c family protein
MHPRPAILFLGARLLLAGVLLAACGGPSTAITHSTTPAGGPRDATQLFEGTCASCHGSAGEGGLSGVSLGGATAADRARIADAIRHGVGAMPASSDGMSGEEIDALAEYVVGLR